MPVIVQRGTTVYMQQEFVNVWYATALMPPWTLLPEVQGLAGAGEAGEVVDTHRCSCVSDVAFRSLASPLDEYCRQPKQSHMKCIRKLVKLRCLYALRI